ncbi:MAG TPA: hypothetical protein VII84_09735 [Acidimicrobiales bacterium]
MSLLKVLFNHCRGPDDGAVGVLARGPSSAALAKEIPALVELDFEGVKSSQVILGQRLVQVRLFEALLFIREITHALQNRGVIHFIDPFDGAS